MHTFPATLESLQRRDRAEWLFVAKLVTVGYLLTAAVVLGFAL